MLWSKSFIPTLKEAPQEAESLSHQLMLRAGLIRMLMAGVYTYLPLGFKVLVNIQAIIRQELDSCDAAELLLPALQPEELWVKTGRDKLMGETMIRFVDRRKRNICLGPTHEEVITDLVKNYVSSYRQLPLILYQIQTKFRDEIRPRYGIVRACEFIMKDAYSFDRNQEGLDKNYQRILEAYQRIFKRCGLNVLTVEADSGFMGGSLSHEFMVEASGGEDAILVCPKCNLTKAASQDAKAACPKCRVNLEKKNALEIGHIFKLGTKYSESLGANFLDEKGKLRPIIMGCYGIGVSRLIAAIIEQNHDSDGIIWPAEISPYQVIILPLDVTDQKIMEKARQIYEFLNQQGLDVLFDDRDERAGVKFKDADLLGISLQVIVGKESLKSNALEVKIRRKNLRLSTAKEDLLNQIKDLVHG